MVNGKSLGNKFEREVCRILSKWLGAPTNKDIYIWRSPSSGGVATINKMYENISGDLIPVHEKAKPLFQIFSIECKYGYNSALIEDNLNDTKKNIYFNFWKQAYEDAKKSNREPFLIFKKRGKKPIVGITAKIYNLLLTNLQNIPYVILYFNNNFPYLYLIDLNKFLNNVSCDKLEYLEKNLNGSN